MVVALSLVLAAISPAFGLGLAVTHLAATAAGLALFAGGLGTVAFAVGAATGRRTTALAAAAGVAAVSYLLSYVAPAADADWLLEVTPYGWYIGGDPLTQGADQAGLGLLAALALVAAALGAVRFARRDLTV